MASTKHGNLAVTATGSGDERRLSFAGCLDETVTLVAQIEAWRARKVVLESEQITSINSIGIREWMHLMSHLAGDGVELVHERCAEVLIEQMCFIPAVRGGGTVRSFFATYICPRCDAERQALIDVEVHREGLLAMHAPGVPCEECKGPMELADVPERIFAFLVDA